MAKLHTGYAAMANSIDAVQIFGGYGYTKEHTGTVMHYDIIAPDFLDAIFIQA
jgi:alkylation response protein AidB-like acyl-CoA dehydrogenase